MNVLSRAKPISSPRPSTPNNRIRRCVCKGHQWISNHTNSRVRDWRWRGQHKQSIRPQYPGARARLAPEEDFHCGAKIGRNPRSSPVYFSNSEIIPVNMHTRATCRRPSAGGDGKNDGRRHVAASLTKKTLEPPQQFIPKMRKLLGNPEFSPQLQLQRTTNTSVQSTKQQFRCRNHKRSFRDERYKNCTGLKTRPGPTHRRAFPKNFSK